MADQKKPERKESRRQFGYGRVTEVHSGDSFSIIGGVVDPKVNPVPPTKEIAISGIQAPYLTRNRSREDEPYAWESREFLRRHIMGKQIRFEVNIQTAGNRDFAQVFLERPGQEPEIMAEYVVKNGWAKVKENKNPNADKIPERIALLKCQAEAEEKGKGIWQKSKKNHTREIVWGASFMVGSKNSREERNQLSDGEFKWAMSMQGKELPAVITRVRDGSTIRCELTELYPDEPHKHKVLLVYLTGVKCPNVPPPIEVQKQMKARRSTYVIQESPPPFALEAQHYVEERLLHQDVHVIINGGDKLGNVYASIKHPRGNISLKLLESGYGTFVQWTASLLKPDELKKLISAKNTGEKKNQRCWTLPKPVIPGAPEKIQFEARVTEVSSGDSFRLDGESVKRHSLASIKCPRSGRRGEEPDRFYIEAREFVRSRIFGKKVKVTWAYHRFDQDFINISYHSQYQNKEIDLSEQLVREGYADCVIHQTSETRAKNYGKLLELEHSAKRGRRGKHGENNACLTVFDLTNRGPPPTAESASTPAGKKRVVTRAEVSVRSAALLKQIKGDKDHKVVVEYCHNGAKFKVFLPDMGQYGYMLNFVCAGINCAYPKPRGGGPIDVWGMKALNLARSKLLQQENVKIGKIEMKDRGDNFLGKLTVGKKDWGLYLIQQGLAQVRYDPEGFYWKAQERAKEDKRGLWKDWVPPEPKVYEPAQEAEQVVEPKKMKNVFDASITEILDATTCFVRQEGDTDYAKVHSAMETFEGKDAENFPPPKSSGMLAAGKFDDGQWYRVRIVNATRGGAYKCQFIDYGTTRDIKGDSLAPLPAELLKIRSTAQALTLAGLKNPALTSDYYGGAMHAFNEKAYGKLLTVKIEGMDGNKMHVSLTPKGSETSINSEMVRDGWCRVLTRPLPKLQGFCKKLKGAETQAKKSHAGIWQYGDVSDEEDEDTGPSWRETGRPPSLAQRLAKEQEKEKKAKEQKKN